MILLLLMLSSDGPERLCISLYSCCIVLGTCYGEAVEPQTIVKLAQVRGGIGLPLNILANGLSQSLHAKLSVCISQSWFILI